MTPTPEALARQIVGEWEGQLTIPVSEMARLDLEQRIYVALTEQAQTHPDCHPAALCTGSWPECERATWEAANKLLFPHLAHGSECEIDMTEFCTCGLRAAKMSARAAAQKGVREIERLTEWKASAMVLLGQYDDIAKRVGGPLGSSKVENLTAYVNTEQERAQESEAWKDTAAQESRNRDYYRRLVVEIGRSLGPAAYVADDGIVHDDVLCAKVPELVREQARKLEEALVESERLFSAIHDHVWAAHEINRSVLVALPWRKEKGR